MKVLQLLVFQAFSVLVSTAEGSSASTPSRTEWLMSWLRNIVPQTPSSRYPPTSNNATSPFQQMLPPPSNSVGSVSQVYGYRTFASESDPNSFSNIQGPQDFAVTTLQQLYQNHQLQQQYKNKQLQQQKYQNQPQHNIQKQQQPGKQSQHSFKLQADHHHDYYYEVVPYSILPQQEDHHSYPRQKSLFYFDPKFIQGKVLQYLLPKTVLSQLPQQPPVKPHKQSSYGSYTKETPKRRPWPLFTNAGKTPEELQREQRELREMMERLRDIRYSQLSEG